jgi:hypothetical protein
MKNQNLICSTNNGDIIIYKNDTDSEEYEKEKHEIIDSNVLKIDKLNEGFLCILTKHLPDNTFISSIQMSSNMLCVFDTQFYEMS